MPIPIRPRLAVSRRRFLFLGISALGAAMTAPYAQMAPNPVWLEPAPRAVRIASMSEIDAILKTIWLPKMIEELNRPSPVLLLSDLQQRP